MLPSSQSGDASVRVGSEMVFQMLTPFCHAKAGLTLSNKCEEILYKEGKGRNTIVPVFIAGSRAHTVRV